MRQNGPHTTCFRHLYDMYGPHRSYCIEKKVRDLVHDENCKKVPFLITVYTNPNHLRIYGYRRGGGSAISSEDVEQ